MAKMQMLIHDFSRRKAVIFLYLYINFDISVFVSGTLCSVKYLLHVYVVSTAYRVILLPGFGILYQMQQLQLEAFLSLALKSFTLPLNFHGLLLLPP